jgi:hypothetical protein
MKKNMILKIVGCILLAIVIGVDCDTLYEGYQFHLNHLIVYPGGAR